MTNQLPPDPHSSHKAPLGFDEFIGIFVAFTVIGAILFWAVAKKNGGFELTNQLSPSPRASAQPTLKPTPAPAVTDPQAVGTPVPTLAPTASPESRAVLPSPTTQSQQAIPVPVVIPNRVTKQAFPVPKAKAPTIAARFVDVPETFWARPYIEALRERGIVTGFSGGYFRPNQIVSRAEFAAMVQKAFDKKPVRSAKTFQDVPSNYWAAPAIKDAYQIGFLNGVPKNGFKPKQQIPRSQVLVSLATGLGLNTKSDPDQVLQIYTDANEIPDYAKNQITAATKAGLVVNYPKPNSLKPNQSVNRAEVAALIYQALVQAGKAKPIQSQYIVQTPS